MRFLLLELILADQVQISPPQLESSSGQEWQYEISTVSDLILAYHLVKNGNITFLLLELILADHLVKNGNFTFLL